MARRPRPEPEVEAPVVPDLQPAPETLVGGAGVTENGVAAPAQGPQGQGSDSPNGAVEQPAPANAPAPGGDASVAVEPDQPETAPQELSREREDGAPTSEQRRMTSSPVGVPASGALEVRSGGGVDQNSGAPPRRNAPREDIRFEAVQIGGENDLLQVREQSEKRTAHLGFRVTEDYLETFKANIHLIAALNRESVETVNTVMLNVMMRSFEHVEAEVRDQKARRRAGNR